MGLFLRHLLEWYSGIAFLAFFFLVIPVDLHLNGTEAFFKSLLWPVVMCEYVETCNEKILGKDISKEDLK